MFSLDPYIHILENYRGLKSLKMFFGFKFYLLCYTYICYCLFWCIYVSVYCLLIFFCGICGYYCIYYMYCIN